MWAVLQAFRLRDAVDILLVAAVLYRVLVMFRGTRAVQMLAGPGRASWSPPSSPAASTSSARAGSSRTSGRSGCSPWSCSSSPSSAGPSPRSGRARSSRAHLGARREQQGHVIDDVVKAAESLAGKRMGALIVLERSTGLRQLRRARRAARRHRLRRSPREPVPARTRRCTTARCSSATTASPRRAASCRCRRNTQLGRAMGTRHRAALGLPRRPTRWCWWCPRRAGASRIAVAGHMESPLDREALRRGSTSCSPSPAPARAAARLAGCPPGSGCGSEAARPALGAQAGCRSRFRSRSGSS